MATWRDKMGPAKFRGVEFHITSAEGSGGRRGPVNEYPFKAKAFKEDTGAKARSFPVEGFVIGKDYLDQKQRLLAALSQEGPGELIHPFYGTLRVAVESWRFREGTAGGRAEVSIEFVETDSSPSAPVAVVDAAQQVESSAATALAAVKAEFLARFVPGVLIGSIVTQVTKFADAINGIVNTVQMEEQNAALFARRVAVFTDSITSLAQAPSDLYDGLTGLISLVRAPSALATLYGFDPGVRPPATTPNREQEQANFDATQAVIQRIAVVNAATIAAATTYDNYESAVAAREAITDLIDDQAETAPDDVYPLFMQLRADLVAAIPGSESDLPHLVKFTPAVPVPSLLLAHQLYGSVDLESDLITRNKVSHPGFVSGDLEVLSSE